MLTLAPVQIYELCRLVRLASVDDLNILACKRVRNRATRWMPVIHRCADGMAFIMPGDELYQEKPDYTGEVMEYIDVPETLDELATKFPWQNRATLRHRDRQLSLVCSIDALDRNIMPVKLCIPYCDSL